MMGYGKVAPNWGFFSPLKCGVFFKQGTKFIVEIEDSAPNMQEQEQSPQKM